MDSIFQKGLSYTMNEEHAQTINVEIEKLIFGGQGLASYNGRRIFVEGVIPGEQAEVKLIESSRSFLHAELVAINQASADRIVPQCPYFNHCGGCDWQFITYDRQIREKEAILRDTFRRLARIELTAVDTFGSQPFGYRSRFNFHRGEDNRYGLKEKKSERVMVIDDCPVAVPTIRTLLTAHPRMEHDRQLVLGTPDSLYLAGRDECAQIILKGETLFCAPSGFFQSNLIALETCIEYLQNQLEAHTIWDLYGGVGVFSRMLASRLRHTIVVESHQEAARFARQNLAAFPAKIQATTVENFLAKRRPPLPDTIIVDPPRTGLSKPVRKQLATCKIPQLVYLSCDPATQARDARVLIDNGYRITRTALFDFYPQTYHIENLLIFSR